MTDNHLQNQDTELTEVPPSPLAAPESSSRKRLLGNSKPEQGSFTDATSDSALSSDSSSDRFRKKTRDLPNLSDCHSCGLHINNSNPKERLQTLDSVWRIVLLCKKCIKRVESAELCSYCFSGAETDCYRCRECGNGIHRDCVTRYRCLAPWSYCCSELGFSVCVDCWIPELLANSNRCYKRRRNKKDALKPRSADDSRVSGCGSGTNLLEDAVNDAKSAVEKKAAVAAKAKENALRKAVVAKRAVELANVALGLVAEKDENGGKNECSVTGGDTACDTTATKVVNDAELAFQLHRAMNSSPRISKNLCLINSSCLPVPRMLNSNSNSSVRSLGSRGSLNPCVNGKIEVCPNNNILNENTDATVSEPSVNVRPSESGSQISLKHDKLVYMRRCKKDKESREKGGGIVVRCNPLDENNLTFESLSCQRRDELDHELHPVDTSKQSHLAWHGNATLLLDGRCNGNPDRYTLKYSKRPVCLKPISKSETKTLCDGSFVESNAKAMRLPLHCSKD